MTHTEEMRAEMPRGYFEHVLAVLLELDKYYPASGAFSDDIGLAIGQTRSALARIPSPPSSTEEG